MPDLREEAMQLLRYEPDTGIFYWLIKRNSRGGVVAPGVIAGTASGQGYVQIKVLGRLWRAHRLAWLFQTGAPPPKGQEIDHINGERADNRWVNLRLATRSRNSLNIGVKANNRSGVTGVSWAARWQKWDARIRVDGQLHYLGRYEIKEDAIAARREAEQRLCPDHRGAGERQARPRHA